MSSTRSPEAKERRKRLNRIREANRRPWPTRRCRSGGHDECRGIRYFHDGEAPCGCACHDPDGVK